MTREEYYSVAEILRYLTSCAVNERIPDKEKLKEINLSDLYTVAEHHSLTAITAFALEDASIQSHSFSEAKAKSIRKQVLMNSQKELLFKQMEQENIWYMPMKGDVLKDLYPRFGMRQMADFDILFDAERAEDVKSILIDMGFNAEHFGTGNHDCYYKEPVYNFEMHRSLFGAYHEYRFQEYYDNVKDRLIKDPEKRFGYHFSPEDFYVYMIAHEYKHYSAGGTGLRSLLDTYVFLSKHMLDMKYVETEVDKLGISQFEQRNRSIAFHLFRNERLTDEEQEILEYILSSGTYGSVEHSIGNRMRNNGWNKFEYAVHRFSVPLSKTNKDYVAFARQYPVFYQYKILIPVLPFYRLYRSLKQGRLKSEFRIIRKIDI